MSMSTHSPEPWTTNDKELLVLAAKANGVPAYWSVDGTLQQRPIFVVAAGGRMGTMPYEQEWNPLKNDVDAFRLAVKLGISILPYPVYAEQKHSVMAKQRLMSDTMRIANPTETIEPYGDDPCAATRRAIVRAAAAIGRAME